MSIKRKITNEKGVTLLELLVAIVIMSMIAGGLAAFFSQSMLFSNKIEEDLDATNINQYALYEAIETIVNVEVVSDSCSIEFKSNDLFEELLDEDDENGNYLVGNRGERYYPAIEVCEAPGEELNLVQVTVGLYQFKDGEELLVSEMHQFIQIE